MDFCLLVFRYFGCVKGVLLGARSVTRDVRPLGAEGMTFNPTTGRITFRLAHPGLLTPGKSYIVCLDVTPKNAATNIKATQVKLTVKVQK